MYDTEYEKGCRNRVKILFPYIFPQSSLSVLTLEQEAKGGKVLNVNPCPGVSRGGYSLAPDHSACPYTATPCALSPVLSRWAHAACCDHSSPARQVWRLWPKLGGEGGGGRNLQPTLTSLFHRDLYRCARVSSWGDLLPVTMPSELPLSPAKDPPES